MSFILFISFLVTFICCYSFFQDSAAPEDNFCKLKNLSEGFIGKIQLLKSGRARLVLGDTILHLEMGTNVGFRQVRLYPICDILAHLELQNRVLVITCYSLNF